MTYILTLRIIIIIRYMYYVLLSYLHCNVYLRVRYLGRYTLMYLYTVAESENFLSLCRLSYYYQSKMLNLVLSYLCCRMIPNQNGDFSSCLSRPNNLNFKLTMNAWSNTYIYTHCSKIFVDDKPLFHFSLSFFLRLIM